MLVAPKGLEAAPPKPPNGAGALLGVPKAGALPAVLKLKAGVLGAAPPKAGALKPAKLACGWLSGAADALAKLKAEDEAPNRPAREIE